MEADIWSMGVILYALLTGRLPFDDENLHVLLAKVKEGKYEIPQFLDEEVKDLISRMLTLNPKGRITLKDIKNHSWWKKMEKKMKLLDQIRHTSSSEEISQQDAIQEKILQHKQPSEQHESNDPNSIDVNITINQEQIPVEDVNQNPTEDAPKKDEEATVQWDESNIDPEVFQSTLEKTGLSEQALKEALMSPE